MALHFPLPVDGKKLLICRLTVKFKREIGPSAVDPIRPSFVQVEQFKRRVELTSYTLPFLTPLVALLAFALSFTAEFVFAALLLFTHLLCCDNINKI